MLTFSGKVCTETSAAQFDVSPVVLLRQRISRAATSLKIIGFLLGFSLFMYLTNFLGFEASLLCALLIPGLASSTAKRLRSGSVRAGAVAAVFWLLWFVFTAFESFPKSLKNGFDVYNSLGTMIYFLPLCFLAWGLIERFRYRPAEAIGGDAYLLANPWEEGRGGKLRPRFLHMKKVDVVFFLILSPLPLLLFWAAPFTDDARFVSDTARWFGNMIGQWLVMLLVVSWCTRIYRRARREAMLPGSALTKNDRRPIVLYLRSFQDDSGIQLRGRATNGRILSESLRKVSFEEVVCDHLWGYGPVLAIGDPSAKGKPAPLGAARNYATDSSWQDQASELMRQASMIVAVAGQTEGLVWEINEILRQEFLSKFLLLFPPVESQELEARWCFLSANMPILGLPADIDLRRARAVIFPEGRATFIYGEQGNDWTYEAVMDQAALAILGASTISLVNLPSPVARATPFITKAAQELAIFARAALLFLAIGAFMLVNWIAKTIHGESSHPFSHPEAERREFIAGIIKACEESGATMSDGALGRFCSCKADRLANSLTYGEYQALESAKRSLLSDLDALKSSFKQKVQEAERDCLETMRWK